MAKVLFFILKYKIKFNLFTIDIYVLAHCSHYYLAREFQGIKEESPHLAYIIQGYGSHINALTVNKDKIYKNETFANTNKYLLVTDLSTGYKAHPFGSCHIWSIFFVVLLVKFITKTGNEIYKQIMNLCPSYIKLRINRKSGKLWSEALIDFANLIGTNLYEYTIALIGPPSIPYRIKVNHCILILKWQKNNPNEQHTLHSILDHQFYQNKEETSVKYKIQWINGDITLESHENVIQNASAAVQTYWSNKQMTSNTYPSSIWNINNDEMKGSITYDLDSINDKEVYISELLILRMDILNNDKVNKLRNKRCQQKIEFESTMDVCEKDSEQCDYVMCDDL